MFRKLALTLALGIFLGLLLLGILLSYWMLVFTKDSAEVAAAFNSALPLVASGLIGTVTSLRQLFFRKPYYLSYGGL